MKSLSIAISLRVSTLLILCVYMFNFYSLNASYNNFLLAINPYILIIFMVLLLLMSREQHIHIKSHPDKPIRLRERILPEFNTYDEREAEITGKAAKTAFSLILIYTPFAIAIVAFLLYYGKSYSVLSTFLVIASIPIAGLVAYYTMYRHHYLK